MQNETQTAAFPILRAEHDVSAFASRDAHRAILHGTHSNAAASLVEATDGHILVRVPVPTVDGAGLPEGRHPAGDCILKTDALKSAFKALPKRCANYNEGVRLSRNGDAKKVILDTAANGTRNELETHVIDGTFPNCEQVIPQDAPKFTICIAADVLLRIGQYVERNSVDRKSTAKVRLEFRDAISPFTVKVQTDSGEALIVGMPMRMK